MSARHTEGPWSHTEYRVFSEAHGRLRQVCFTANNIATRTPEARANARLIAAAPAMLAALEAAKREIRSLAQSGTERIRELGGKCDHWKKTADITTRRAGIDAALSAARGDGKSAPLAATEQPTP